MNRRRCLLALTGGLSALIGCFKKPVAVTPPTPSVAPLLTSVVDPHTAETAPQLTRYPVRFTDVTAQAGLQWKHENGATGRFLFVEPNSGGVAFFDYNNDGLLDIFAVQGGPVPGATGNELKFNKRNALFRNNGDGTFTDVTQGSGLEQIAGYGQGVSVADYDNDGWPDLYITAYGGNRLFRNNRNGTFTDVTERAGVADLAKELLWPQSSAWGDYDNDGHLDLFVCHYVHWSPALDQACIAPSGQRFYCRPQVYEPSHCTLYHNNGDGTFTDVTEKAGLLHLPAKSMGAAWFDYDDDGWMDLFVSNDMSANFLLHNNRNGTFTDQAIVAGVAVANDGTPQAGMGVGVGDYGNEGRESLFVVNFAQQPKSVFHNEGSGLFTNATGVSNVGSTNLQFLGFGVECFDYDLDGWKDVVVGNGHVQVWKDSESGGSTAAQSQQLLHNQGDKTFTDDWRSLGDLVKPRVTRGLAIGDYDNDGDQDIVLFGLNGPLQLFRNDGGNQHHWITLRLEGVYSNRDAIGAKITLRAGGMTQTQWVRGGSSYCSHSDTRVTFGLRDTAQIDALEIRWPRDGRQQKFGPLAANAFYWIKEGGAPLPDPRSKAAPK